MHEYAKIVRFLPPPPRSLNQLLYLFLKTYNFTLILGSQVVERLMIINCNAFIVV